MVRLNQVIGNRWENPELYFNSTMVRLNHGWPPDTGIQELYFNSTMVRLNPRIKLQEYFPMQPFQFHYG